jgi:hypothetical protein
MYLYSLQIKRGFKKKKKKNISHIKCWLQAHDYEHGNAANLSESYPTYETWTEFEVLSLMFFTIIIIIIIIIIVLVVRVPGYRSKGPGFDSRRNQIF